MAYFMFTKYQLHQLCYLNNGLGYFLLVNLLYISFVVVVGVESVDDEAEELG